MRLKLTPNDIARKCIQHACLPSYSAFSINESPHVLRVQLKML